MQVQQWTYGRRRTAAPLATYDLERLGMVAVETEVDGAPAVVVVVEPGRQSEVERVFRLLDGDLAATEDVADDSLVARALRGRPDASAVMVPFDREQVGVRVVLEDGTVVDVDQGVTYEVRHTENLHVLRGQRRVAVFRAGSWRYAQRSFADQVAGRG